MKGLIAVLALAGGQEILSVKDIKPGMKGYGLTVFEGTVPEKFEFEVVGILHNDFGPKQDTIVVRSSHPVLSHTGICGGMSGSPMYIEGRLIGAASHFFKLFPKDLLTGVTPIERMIADGKRPANPAAEATEGSGVPGPKKTNGASHEPIPLPFFVSGVGPRTEALVRQFFEPYGIEVLRGGSGGMDAEDPNAPSDLQPGDAFGVQLMRGDIEIASGGTVTYREGSFLLGFGHNFFGGGDILMPMTTARVFTVMSSLQRSDKMQVALREVGALTIDRQSCVAGEMGRKAPMIPLVVRTRNASTGQAEEFRCEMMRHKILSPALFNFALSNAIESAESTILPTTVDLSTKVWLEGRKEPIALKETYAIEVGPTNYYMPFPVVMLANNPFAAVKLERIEADAEVTHEKRTADIEAAWLDVNEVKPGGEVNLTVVVRPYNREPERFVVPLRVPANLPDEVYDLEVGGGSQTEPDAAAPKNVEDLVRLLQAKYRASDLVTVMELGTIGTRQEGKALRQLPFSVFGTLFASASAGITVVPDTLRIVTPTKFVLNGKKALKIKVTTKGGGS